MSKAQQKIPTLLTVQQARDLFNRAGWPIGVKRTYELVADGTFPPGVVFRLGGRIRFVEENLIAFIRAGGVQQKREAAS